MHVFFVQRIEILGYVVIIRIEFRIALGLPPEPVLHNRIEWDMLLAIALRNLSNLVERDVTILRLKEAIGPLGQQGRVAGHGSVRMENSVDLRAVKEVVINRLAGHRGQLHIEGKAIVEVSERRRVPHQPIAFARNQQRNRDIGVVLPQFHRGAAIVEHAALVLPQSIHRLRNCGRESVRDTIGVIAIELDRFVGPRDAGSFVQQ